jgi:hypothetical protein
MDSSPPEIRGDLLFDRLLGWGTFTLAVIVGVFSAVIPHAGPAPAATLQSAFEHYRLLLLTCVGGVGLSRASRSGYIVALVSFGIRVLADTADLGVHHGDRFISMAWTFDLALTAYCIYRLRARRSEG